MTAAELLTQIEQAELVDPEIIASLRKQVAAAAQPVSPAAIMKLLVEKGQLTSSQANRFLPAAPAKPAPSKPAPAAAKPSTITKQPAAKTPPAAKKPPADPLAPLGSSDLAPLGDGLDPLGGPDPLGGLDPLGGEGLAPLGDLAPLDDLGGLDSLGGDPLGALGGADLQSLAARAGPASTPLRSPAAAASAATGGGETFYVGMGLGITALLVVVIGLAVYFWPRGTGEREFQFAEEAFQQKEYAVAVERYNKLLTDFPQHAQGSLARVHRALAELHASRSTPPNWPRLLPVVSAQAARILQEPEAAQALPELTPLVLDLARGTAELAFQERSSAELPTRLEQGRAALALANDARLVPNDQRPWRELAQLEAGMNLLARDLASSARRESAKQELSQLLATGESPAAALDARRKLLREYPELRDAPLWQELAPAWEKAAVRWVQSQASPKPAETAPAVDPPRSTIQLAAPVEGPSGPVSLLTSAGAVWALDATRGAILWSRYSGGDDPPLAAPSSGAVFLLAPSRQELLRVKLGSGAVEWRRSLPAAVAGLPALADDRLFLALVTGELWSLDSQTGAVSAIHALQQPLSTGPVLSADGSLILQLADEGLLYAFTPAGKCQQAWFLGHQAGTSLPPLAAPGGVVITINSAGATRLWWVPQEGAAAAPKAYDPETPLTGSPVRVGQRIWVTTGKEAISFRLSGDAAEPLSRLPPQALPENVVRLAAAGDALYGLGAGLVRFRTDASGKLQTQWTSPQQQPCEAVLPLEGGLLSLRRNSAGQPLAVAIDGADKFRWQATLANQVRLEVNTGEPWVISPSGAAARLDAANPPACLALAAATGQPSTPRPIPPRAASIGSLLFAPQANGLFVTTDLLTGQSAGEPFLLPRSGKPKPGAAAVLAVDAEKKQAVITAGDRGLLLLEFIADPPRWRERLAWTCAEPCDGPAALAGEFCWLRGTAGGLHGYQLKASAEPLTLNLHDAAVLGGPYAIAGAVLVATDRDELLCLDGADIRWRQSLAGRALAGPPIALPGGWICGTSAGDILLLEPASGKTLQALSAGEPLAGSPLAHGKQLLAPTAAGAVVVLPLPELEAAK